ncbi:MAG: FixH family protein [Bradyrhizobiaceae bacterium]|nr:FixH family protein [Bradyrhizobiaceae bacterium]
MAAFRLPQRVTGRMVLFSLVAFFAVIFAANFTLATLAVSTFGGVETKNAYQAGLAYSREIAAARAQESRHWKVDAVLSPLRADGVTVEVTAKDGADFPLAGIDFTATFVHPADRRQDSVVPLNASGSGRYRGLARVPAGQWDLVVEASRDGERMFRSKSRVQVR